jgi:hypothetical protein
MLEVPALAGADRSRVTFVLTPHAWCLSGNCISIKFAVKRGRSSPWSQRGNLPTVWVYPRGPLASQSPTAAAADSGPGDDG